MDPRQFYNKTAHVYDERHGSMTTSAIRKREAAMLSRFMRGRVLDMGCGTGYHLGRHSGIIGLDISDNMLKIAAAKGRQLVQADAARLPFRPGSFDTIISMFNVMDREDLAYMAHDASAAVKSGGHFLLSMASVWDNDYTFMKKLRMPEKSLTKRKSFHVSGSEVKLDLYTVEELEGIFANSGFEPRYFDSAFIWQRPDWGNLRPLPIAARARLALERILPKRYGCMYFMAFRKMQRP